MVDSWVRGAERISAQRSGAAYRLSSSRWRFVWHSMEAPANATTGGWSTVAGLKSYISGHQAPPHLWCWPERDWVGQTVPLTLSAYALRHEAGDPETNHRHAIQCEVLGYAKDARLSKPEFADWLGRRVLAPVLAAGVPLDPFKVAPSTGSDGYGLNGRVRQSWDWWAAFNGQCGHANVPGNSHWDPGVADYLRIARAATNQQEEPLKLDAEDQAWIAKLVEGEVRRATQFITTKNNVVYNPEKEGSEWVASAATLPKLLDAVVSVSVPGGDVTALAKAVADELHRRMAS